MNKSRLSAAAGLGLWAVVSWTAPAQAQGKAPDWLLGEWQGEIRGALKGPAAARSLRVYGTGADGKIHSQWKAGPKWDPSVTTTMDGDSVVVTTPASVTKLKKMSDNELAGTFTTKDGKSPEIGLRRVVEPSKYDGKWNGRARTNNTSCWSGTYQLHIAAGHIRGYAQFSSADRRHSAGSTVAGFLDGDDARIVLFKQDANGRDSVYTVTFDGTRAKGTDPHGKCPYEVSWEKN